MSVSPYTPSLVLAALLGVTPVLAAPGSPDVPLAVSAPSLTTTTGVSGAEAYASSSTRAPAGTGRLFLGGYVGFLSDNGIAPNLGLEVAGPLPIAGLPPSLRLEWTGALDLWFRSDSARSGNFEVDTSLFSIGVMPGGRVIVPILPEVLLHADLGAGLAVTHASVDTTVGDVDRSETDFGIVFRAAAGAIIPLSEQLRLDVVPLALQAYSSGGTAFTMRVGLSFALN